MNEPNVIPGALDPVLEVGVLSRVLLRCRWFVLSGIVIGLCVALILALTITPTFRADVVVTEAQNKELGSTSSLLSQFGGLASMAGLSVGGNSETRDSQAVLKSRHLIEEFLRRNQMVETVLAKDRGPKTLWRAVERFRTRVLTIRPDQRVGTTTIGIEWTDAQTAAAWANDFARLANDLLRTRALEESKRNIDYLNEQIAHTSVVDVQKALYALVENETKTLMLANAQVEYAFRIVDPAVAPEDRYAPRRLLYLLAGAFGGLVLGALAGIVWYASRHPGPASRVTA